MSRPNRRHVLAVAGLILAATLLTTGAWIAEAETVRDEAPRTAPVRVRTLRDLSFGKVIAWRQTQLRLDPATARLSASPARQVYLLGDHTPGRFLIQAEPGRLLDLELPSAFTLQRGPQRRAVVRHLTLYAFERSTGQEIRLRGSQLEAPPSGEVVVDLGGTLDLQDASRTGPIAERLTLTVRYLDDP